jgi:hypothetical protein
MISILPNEFIGSKPRILQLPSVRAGDQRRLEAVRRLAPAASHQSLPPRFPRGYALLGIRAFVALEASGSANGAIFHTGETGLLRFLAEYTE